MFVLQRAERMNPTSANALLKLLEEPNPSTVIVLITDSVHALLPTILSRCRKIRLSPLPPESIAKQLQMDGVPEEKANQVAAVCGGKLEGIDQLLEGSFFEERLAWLDRITALRQGTDFDSLALSSEIASWKREGALEFIAWLAGLFRDAIWLRSTGETSGLMHTYAADRIGNLFDDMSERDLIELFEAAVEVRRRLRGNANIELTAGALLFRLLPRRHLPTGSSKGSP
jgi:DNA polymerase-3 subunit delta'